MVKAYPQFRSSYSHEEMVEHFLLTPAELQLVLTCRGDANRCGMALLMKTISHLGYVPDPMPQIPEEVRAFVAAQLGLPWSWIVNPVLIGAVLLAAFSRLWASGGRYLSVQGCG